MNLDDLSGPKNSGINPDIEVIISDEETRPVSPKLAGKSNKQQKIRKNLDVEAVSLKKKLAVGHKDTELGSIKGSRKKKESRSN